ncbi:glycosyltransferase [Rhodococcus sp. T2V]|uniref:glycosyltransferase family 2 protein n=1 Tax=Rhodococcus sp. T2V TaxID=3034164 RepID=UPI0023E33223|nr:glycosyltransferase [Rhodococcus sp. T2V]MDF3303406.1 glycosyltransferase [Rhodococcus sp. T2V]
MKVSAVVRCLNEAQHIGRLVEGMRKQSVPVGELIFVDSGSTDGTLDIISDLGDKVVHIDRSEFSFGRSLNRGISEATGDVVLICSAHVYPVYDTWVQKLVEPFSRDSVAYAYGRQEGDHRTKFSESRVMESWFPSESIHRQPYAFANNANSIIRRKVWDSRPFDESLTGLEDVDWANYVIKSGLDISYQAEAVVKHVHEESWSTIRNRYRREAIAYKRIIESSSLSLLSASGLVAANVIQDYVSATRRGVLFPHFFDIPAFRFCQFIGAWQGFNGNLPEADLLSRFYYPSKRVSESGTVDGQEIEYAGE